MTAKGTAQQDTKSSRSVFDERDRLQALDAARAIMRGGPLAYGQDGRFWSYEAGVWGPGKEEVHARVVDLLGNKYRRGHEADILGVTQALVPRMECEAVERFVNFGNGLLDWRTGQIHEHTDKVLSTVQMGCDWDAEAACPDFDRFLSEVLYEDDIGRFWEITGYLMMSGNPLHKAILLHGKGRNGKGVALGVWSALLGGKKNVSNIPLHQLASNRFATAQLLGMLANIGGDIDSTYITETGRIKEITGGDTLFAENKGENGFSFTPWCKLVFSANELPGSSDASTGWADRWEVIPFPRYFGDKKDVTLLSRLASPASLAGIAVRAVEALRMLMERGQFLSSASARDAHNEMREASNSSLEWYSERALPNEGASVTGARAYDDYKLWCVDVGRKHIKTAKTFYSDLEMALPGDVRATKTNNQKTYHGFQIRPRPAGSGWLAEQARDAS